MGEAARTPPSGWSGCQSGRSAPCRATCLRQSSPMAPLHLLHPQLGLLSIWLHSLVPPHHGQLEKHPRRSKAAQQSPQLVKPTEVLALALAALLALSTLSSAGHLFFLFFVCVWSRTQSELSCMCINRIFCNTWLACERDGNKMHKWKAVNAPTLSICRLPGNASHAAVCVCRACWTALQYVCQ